MNTASADTMHHSEAGSGRTRTSGAKRMKTGLAAMLVFLGTFAGAIAIGVTPAGASTLNGVATITNPVSNAPFVSGSSASNFTVTLPAVSGKPAHCTGASNSRTDSYHVFSYMVKKGVSPTSVSFKTGYPSTGLGYFTSSGVYYGKANTAATTGQIIDIPNNLDFAELLAKHVTLATLLYTSGKSGIWEAGLACANSSGKVTDNWNSQVTLTSSTSDPNKFVWSVPVYITTASLASVKTGAKISDTLKAAGGHTPYTWAITKALPSGLKLSTAGLLSGTLAKTVKAGKYPVDVKVTDSSKPTKVTATADFTLTVT